MDTDVIKIIDLELIDGFSQRWTQGANGAMSLLSEHGNDQ